VIDLDEATGGQERFLSATGRRIDFPETQVAIDPATGHLAGVGGSRVRRSGDRALERALKVLGEQDGIKTDDLVGEIGGSKVTARRAVKRGIRDGLIRTSPGNPGIAHHLAQAPLAGTAGAAGAPGPLSWIPPASP
jgi:hypothetical protein